MGKITTIKEIIKTLDAHKPDHPTVRLNPLVKSSVYQTLRVGENITIFQHKPKSPALFARIDSEIDLALFKQAVQSALARFVGEAAPQLLDPKPQPLNLVAGDRQGVNINRFGIGGV